MLRHLLFAFLLFTSTAFPAPPETPQMPVVDVYHSVPVTDEYRWLENWDDATVQAWSETQNDHARRVLDKLPGVKPLREKLTKIMAALSTSHGHLTLSGGRLFALRRLPPKQHPFLVVMPSAEMPDQARILLDPAEYDRSNSTAIDWFVPSPDGTLVAVSLSKAGSESGDVSLIVVETGNTIDVVIPRVNGGTAGGDLAWAPDSQGFYYTRYPRGTERPAGDMDFYQQLYFHKLGTPTEADRCEMGAELPRIAEIKIEVEQRTARVLATVQFGDSGQFSHFVRSPETGKWTSFAGFQDGVVQAVFGPLGELYVVSRHGAPRGEVLRLDGQAPNLSEAKVVIPEGTDTIVTDFYSRSSRQTVLPMASRLYVTYQLGGPSTIRCFALDGKSLPGPQVPEIASVGDLVPAGGDDVFFGAESFTVSFSHFRFRAEQNETLKLPLTSPSIVDLSDIQVQRQFATSPDGTRVPVSLLIPQGVQLDGTNPCLVTGYGGYGSSVEPGFRPISRILFDHGFIVAVANLRGGGEYGEEWHTSGNLTNKQNVFDDFAATLQHLIDRKYTSPSQLAIEGGSNGGLLMGAMLTQHPEMVKCVVSHVGIYDMLRVELSPNGAFNIPEFGTVTNEEHFKALHAYSPYHHVQNQKSYPAVLFLTGANDPRVDPMQSRKMTARLQASAASPSTVLLRTSAGSGHGAGTALDEQIEQRVDVYAFLFNELGVRLKSRDRTGTLPE